MASVYSLRLLQHEVAREWLLAREEPKLPPSFMESSLALRHRVFLGSKPKFVDQLFQPIGVVNGVLIGYVSGETAIGRNMADGCVKNSHSPTIIWYYQRIGYLP